MKFAFTLKVPPEGEMGGGERHHVNLAKYLGEEVFYLCYDVSSMEEIGSLFKGKFRRMGRISYFPVRNLTPALKSPLRYYRYYLGIVKDRPELVEGFPPMIGYFPPRMMREALKEISPDFLHVYAPHAFWLPYVACLEANSLGIPYSVWTLYHPHVKNEKARMSFWKVKEILKGAEKVISSTEWERRKVSEEVGLEEEKTCVLPVPVDLAEFRKPTQEQIERTEEELGEYEFLVLSCTLQEKKGSLFLLKSLSKYEGSKRILLAIFGRKTPQGEREFMELSRRLPKNVKAVYLGYVPEFEKSSLYYLCDVFAMPSLAETFGIAYAEAWYFEKPVIGAKIPPIEEVFSAGRRGLLVKYGDEKGLLEALLAILEDQELRKKLGREGKRYLFEELAAEKVARRFKEILGLSSSGRR